MIHIDFWNLDRIFQIHVLQCNSMTNVWIFLKFAQHTEIVAVNNLIQFWGGSRMISGSRINYSGLRLLIQVTLPILDVSF